MSTREKQSIFLVNVAKLILYAHEVLKVELTGGELYRTEEQQAIYLKSGKSKVERSLHQDRLAIDFNLFIDGKYITEPKEYRPLVQFWKELHPDNRAGFDWGWDANHFEMKLS